MKKVNYTKELLEEKIQNCYSFAELCRRLGLKPEGSNPKTVKKKLEEFGVDYSHFTGKAWNKNAKNPVYRGKYLPNLCEHSSLSTSNVKALVYRLGLKENRCELCGISEWQGKPITCELHHIMVILRIIEQRIYKFFALIVIVRQKISEIRKR